MNATHKAPAYGGEPQVMNGPGSAANGTRFAPFEGRSSLVLRRTTIFLIILFLTTQFSVMTFLRFVRMPDESLEVIFPRFLVLVCGFLFSLFNMRVQRRVGRATLRKRVGVAVVMAFAGAYFHAFANVVIFGMLIGFGHSTFPEYLVSYAMFGLDWLWIYTALSVLILALAHAADLAESEERVVALQGQAHAAQLQALRYQLNPHFLFNTLNSVAALISKRRSTEAETMVECLSDFLRSTLTMDGETEITLGREIELQSLYLDIEAARFPDRLNVVIDVPEALRDALVPNLITQPLVENAIKYGVARSSARVTLGITARAQGEALSLEVWDDGGNADTPALHPGTKVGLRNVSERLQLHFGTAASFAAAPRDGGGFTARISMPLKREE